MERQACLSKGCFAAFDAERAQPNDVRHCNRSGPDGGHAHQWDGTQWRLLVGVNEHDQI